MPSLHDDAPTAAAGTSQDMPAAAGLGAFWLAAGSFILIAAFAWVVLINSIPTNTLTARSSGHSGHDAAAIVRAVSPQGWSFFTRDARERTYEAWKPDGDGEWRKAAPLASGHVKFAFGMNRSARLLDGDVLYLVEKAGGGAPTEEPAQPASDDIPGDDDQGDLSSEAASEGAPQAERRASADVWTDCGSAKVADCIANLPDRAPKMVEYEPVADDVCGRVVIVRQAPIPWAFAGLTNKTLKSILEVDAQCLAS